MVFRFSVVCIYMKNKNTRLLDTLEQKRNAYDECCKKILLDPQIMAYILKECVNELSCFSRKEIEHLLCTNMVIGNTEDLTVSGAKVCFDICFQIPDKNLIIDLEAQSKDPSAYPLLSRAIYYGNRLLDGQIEERYGSFRKVYSIWILLDPARDGGNVINVYRVNEKTMLKEYKGNEAYYDLVCIVMIGVPKENEEPMNELMGLLQVLFVINQEVEYIKTTLIQKYGILLTKELDQEVDAMCNWSEVVYQNAMRKGMQEGMQKGMQKGIQKGMQEGIQKGIQRGMDKGIQKGNRDSALLHTKKIMERFLIGPQEAMDVLDIQGQLREDLLKELE